MCTLGASDGPMEHPRPRSITHTWGWRLSVEVPGSRILAPSPTIPHEVVLAKLRREHCLFSQSAYLPRATFLTCVPPDHVSERGIPSGFVHLAQEFNLHVVLTSLPISRSYTFHLTTHVTWIRCPGGQASVWQFGDFPQVNPTLILPSRWSHQAEDVSREHQWLSSRINSHEKQQCSGGWVWDL